MMNYEVEELLPIVAELAEKYTSKESTSISYDKARQLMEAVLYCMNHCESKNQLVSSRGLSAKEAYQAGYEKVIENVKETQNIYNEMIINFCGYGNENYQDTVTKAIPGFFRYYDARFAPQETIITMDYPILCPVVEEIGIDAIQKYVQGISYEQKFLGALPRDYVQEVLHQFLPVYRKAFFNICNILFRHILGHMILGKGLGNILIKEDYRELQNIILNHDTQWLEKTILSCLRKLIEKKYEDDKLLESYLQRDLKDFVFELQIAAKNESLPSVVVL